MHAPVPRWPPPGSSPGSLPWPASDAGSLPCSPGGTAPWSSSAGGADCVGRGRTIPRSANTYAASGLPSVCPPSYTNDRESHRRPPRLATSPQPGQEENEEGKKRRKEIGGKKIAYSFKPDVSLHFQNGADTRQGTDDFLGLLGARGRVPASCRSSPIALIQKGGWCGSQRIRHRTNENRGCVAKTARILRRFNSVFKHEENRRAIDRGQLHGGPFILQDKVP